MRRWRCERLLESLSQRRQSAWRREMFRKESMEPGEAEPELRNIVLRVLIRRQRRAGGGKTDEHTGTLRSFRSKTAAGNGRLDREHRNNGEAFLIEHIDGGGREVELAGSEARRIERNEEFVVLGSKQFEGFRLPAARNFAEASDASEFKLASDESVEEISLLVVHAEIISAGGSFRARHCRGFAGHEDRRHRRTLNHQRHFHPQSQRIDGINANSSIAVSPLRFLRRRLPRRSAPDDVARCHPCPVARSRSP